MSAEMAAAAVVITSTALFPMIPPKLLLTAFVDALTWTMNFCAATLILIVMAQ